MMLGAQDGAEAGDGDSQYFRRRAAEFAAHAAEARERGDLHYADLFACLVAAYRERLYRMAGVAGQETNGDATSAQIGLGAAIPPEAA